MTGANDYAIDRLDSGLTVLTAPMPSTRSATLMVMAGAGSRYEDKRINGLSHFMEHMFFKGAKRYPDAMAVASAIDSIGGVFNAFTAEEKVAYFVKLSAAKKETAYDVLSDMLLDSRFDKEEIDRERGVIIEEIRMYNDDPMSKVHTDFTRHFYGDQPLGWDIAGPEENIMSVTRDDFLKFRETHYPASACVVIAAGNVTHEENLSFAQKYFRFDNNGAKVAPKPFQAMGGDRSLLTERKIEQAHFVLGYPVPGEEDPVSPPLKVLSNILGGTMSSRLFYQIRERRGLAYYIRSARHAYTDTGAMKISAGVNVDKVEEALSAIMDEVAKICDKGITVDELGKGKENLKGKNDLALEDSMTVAMLYGVRQTLFGKVKTPEAINAEIDAVTLEEVNQAAAKYLDPAKVKMAILGPYDDVTPFDKKLDG